MKKIILLMVTVVIVLLDITPSIAKADENNVDVIEEKEISTVNNDGIDPLQARGLVFNANWFFLKRTEFTRYEDNYQKNKKLEVNMGYIYGQNKCPNFYIGDSRMSKVGCEIAATYNALKLRGRTVPCANIIRTFEKNGYLLTAGFHGSDPYAIGEYFENNISVKCTKYTDFDNFKSRIDKNVSSATMNVYIASVWNGDSVLDGLHTFAFYTRNNKLYVYNYEDNNTTTTTSTSINRLINSKWFIVGYYVPDMGRRIRRVD